MSGLAESKLTQSKTIMILTKCFGIQYQVCIQTRAQVKWGLELAHSVLDSHGLQVYFLLLLLGTGMYAIVSMIYECLLAFTLTVVACVLQLHVSTSMESMRIKAKQNCSSMFSHLVCHKLIPDLQQ